MSSCQGLCLRSGAQCMTRGQSHTPGNLDQWQQTLSSWQPATPASIRSNIFSGQCEIFSCADLDLGMGMMMSTADVYVLPVLQTVTMTMVLDHDTSVSMVTRELLSPHSSTAVMVTDIPTLECRAPVTVPPPTSVPGLYQVETVPWSPVFHLHHDWSCCWHQTSMIHSRVWSIELLHNWYSYKCCIKQNERREDVCLQYFAWFNIFPLPYFVFVNVYTYLNQKCSLSVWTV